ncbi:pirin domain-containing protein, partial [Dentipellis sp. KUC8613]
SAQGYYAGGLNGFGDLRVMAEDRIKPYNGFELHGHKEFEIFTYVIHGELEHKDSMGNVEIIKAGDIQLTSAGTGIRHSEVCHGPKEVHLMQIWTLPSQSGLTPKYYTRHFTDEEKANNWVRVVAPVESKEVTREREGTGPAPVHSNISLWVTRLGVKAAISRRLPASASGAESKAYLQVTQKSGFNRGPAQGAIIRVKFGESVVSMSEGDGAFIYGREGDELNVENISDITAEILLFDV